MLYSAGAVSCKLTKDYSLLAVDNIFSHGVQVAAVAGFRASSNKQGSNSPVDILQDRSLVSGTEECVYRRYFL